MSNYCFPIQSIKKLVEFLRNCYENVDISEEDFRSPERKKWQKIYTLLVCDSFPDLSPDILGQMPMRYGVQYPELHEESMSLFNLLKSLQVLLPICGVNDFKITDLISPKTNRLVRMMSALMNFRFFQEERFDVFQRLKSENDALQDQREVLSTENEELKQKINAIKARQAEKQVEIQCIVDSLNELVEKTSELFKSVKDKQQEASELKVLIAELKSTLNHYKEEILKEKERNAKLSSRIVPSPNRLKDEMERMKNQLAEAEQLKQQLEARLAELTKRYQLLQERDKEADMALRCVQALQEEKDKQSKVLAAVNNIQEETNNKRTEMKQLDIKIQQLRLQITNKEGKIDNMSLQHRVKLNDRKETLERLKNDLDSVQEIHGEQYSQCQALQNQIDRVIDEQQAELAAYQEAVDRLNSKKKQLDENLDCYHQLLSEAFCHMQTQES